MVVQVISPAYKYYYTTDNTIIPYTILILAKWSFNINTILPRRFPLLPELSDNTNFDALENVFTILYKHFLLLRITDCKEMFLEMIFEKNTVGQNSFCHSG